MKKTRKVNEILDFIDKYSLTYEEFWRIISELEILKENADSMEDIKTLEWFEEQKTTDD